MERIKQAIENAKKPEASRAGRPDSSHVHSHYAKGTRVDHWYSLEKLKIVIAFVLILFAGWLWMRLDFMNRIELIASEYIHDGVKQARAEAKKRMEDEANFKKLILTNLTHCQDAAEKNKESYLKLMQNAVQVKNKNEKHATHEQFILPNTAITQANKMLESAKTECQQIYDKQLRDGR